MIFSAFGVYLFAMFATGVALQHTTGPGSSSVHWSKRSLFRRVNAPKVRWSNGSLVQSPKGSARDRECGHPPLIANADFNVIDNPPYPEGTNVSYACKDGFKREGRITYICSNGDWGVDLICNQIRCETLRDPENGFIVNPQRFVPAVTINFECNPGYTLQGPASLTCIIDGQWRPSDPPTCQIKNCCPFPAVANADVYQYTFSSEGNVYGQTVTITCNTGFTLNGRRVSQCKASGKWELPAPACDGEKENFDKRYLLLLLLLLLPLGVGAYCKREKIKDVCSSHKSDKEAKKTDPEAGESFIVHCIL